MNERILVVDDDPGFRKLLETILKQEGYQVEAASGVVTALHLAEKKSFHLILTDLRMADGDGMQVLRWAHDNSPATPVIMITAFGTVSGAVDAMKLGAFDYLGKPLSSPDELRLIVRRALDQAAVRNDREVLREEFAGRFSCDSMLATDPRMRKAIDLIQRVAPTDATVLILGESGTGKELIARCVHANSPRAQRVFVAVNCAALTASLIESELFGHEKGAFTGAVGQHAGRFERAHGGTLFLDEIGELDANLQAKLLRVLHEKTFERVGGSREISVDVRMIAATNRNLKERVAEGKFREDLYYRLNMFPVEVPPLRERRDDIPLLAHHFLERAGRKLGRKPPVLTPESEQVLRNYNWPGNVRELENLMERLAILCDDVVEPDDLPVTSSGPVRGTLFSDIEKKAILDALDANQGNRTRTAKQLGISLRTLQYRLKEYGITRDA
ncbi:MAG: sigma-54 dependent transcriptional regulator [Bryobacter sp.]|nr:sigma-54 dependent transcriptional regulator [Bryobacter sp.]